MAKGKRILKAGIKRETGFLYYLNSDLDVFKVKMVRGGEKKKKSDKRILVLKTDLSRDKGSCTTLIRMAMSVLPR